MAKKRSSRKSSEADRDFVGYANRKFDFAWPDRKRLALSLVVNYEEGSEHSYAVDKTIEGIGEFLPVDVPVRDPGNESSYEYGPRVAVWRLLNTFKRYDVKATFFATALALKANELAAKAIVDQGHEICDHGLRWIEHFKFSRREEEGMIRKSVEIIEDVTGRKPVGFYAREPSDNTIDIVSGMKNFIYDSDEYNDDLPYRYRGMRGNTILILPYTPDANDFHFQSPMHRFSNSEDFFIYLKDTFDVLREEALESPKMMSVGLHCRVIGRPGRIVALRKFLEYVNQHSDSVWVATREQIARYWIEKVEGKGLLVV